MGPIYTIRQLAALPARAFAPILASAVFASACVEASGPEPMLVAAVSGDGQEAVVGDAAPEPLVVRVAGMDAVAREGVPVAWEVVEGGGSVVARSPATDADGRVEATWTMGEEPSEQAVRATAGSESVTFRALATPPFPDDWIEYLDPVPDPWVEGDTLRAGVWIINRWPGTVRLTTPMSCLGSDGHPRLYDGGGDEVARAWYGCLTAQRIWSIPLGDSLYYRWDLNIPQVPPGEYTLRYRFDVSRINDEPGELPGLDATVVLGGD